MRNRALGRGLSSLLNEEIIPIEIAASSNNIDLDLIEANQDQPRKYFDASWNSNNHSSSSKISSSINI